MNMHRRANRQPGGSGGSLGSSAPQHRSGDDRPADLLARQQAVVAALGVEALRGASMETLLRSAVRSVAKTLGVELVKVLELLPDGERLLVGAGAGWKRGTVGRATVEADRESQAGYTLLSDSPVVVVDLGAETRFSAPALLADHRVVSGMSTVIYGPDRPWGILGAHTRKRRIFQPDEVDFLQSVANILAAAIERQHIDGERLASGALVATLVEAAPLALILLDPDGLIRVWSRGAERLFGWSAEEVVGTRPPLSRPDEQPPADELIRRILAGETIRGLSFQSRRKDGTRLELSLHATAVRDPHGRISGVMAAMADLTQRRRLETRLEEVERDHGWLAASMSQLRTLGTPEETAQRICEEVARWPEFDGATLYATTGDGGLVPIGVASMRKVPVRIGQRVPAARARYLLARAITGPWVEELERRPATDIDRAWRKVGTRFAAYAPVVRDRKLIGLLGAGTTLPIGIDRLTRRLPVLNDYASLATALVGGALATQETRTRHVEKIRSLIRRRRFSPVFQPIVEIASRRPVGWEALTRFDDGRSPPHAFEDADSVGLLHELELACVEVALAAAEQLPGSTWLSLNASPGLVLTSRKLPELLRATDRAVVIEITEHTVVDDYPMLHAALQRLPFGTRVAIDDAGTGYAGLQQILELRPDIVKLDMVLIRRIEADLAQQALVTGMVHFAAQIGCTLVAEGVETEAEAVMLDLLGVTHAQGYLFGPPAPAQTWRDPQPDTPPGDVPMPDTTS